MARKLFLFTRHLRGWMTSVAIPSDAYRVVEFSTNGGRGYTVKKVDAVAPDAWVPSLLGFKALMALDAANNRGYFRGQNYDTEASFLTAVGGSKAGTIRTIGPSKFGAELVPEGAFSNAGDAALWTPMQGTLAVSGGALAHTNNTGAAASIECYRDVAFEVGKSYEIRVNGSSPAYTRQVQLCDNTGAVQMLPASNRVAGAYIINLTSQSASIVRLKLRANNVPNGSIALWDDVSIKEAYAVDGFVANGGTIILDRDLPSALPAADIALADVDGRDNRNRAQLIWTASGVVQLVCSRSLSSSETTVRVTATVGTFSAGSRLRIALNFKGGSYRCSVNGRVAVNLSTTADYPPGSAFHINGNALGAAEPANEFRLFAYFPKFCSDIELSALSDYGQTIWHEGDSYDAGAYDISLSNDFATRSGRPIYLSGAGGSTLTQIRDRILARPELNGMPIVIWDGSANPSPTDLSTPESIAKKIDLYGQIIAAYGGPSRMVIVPSVSVGPSADGLVSAYTVGIEQIRDYLISRGVWPAGVANDPTTRINALSTGTAQDLRDISARTVLYSVLSDPADPKVHLKQPAMTIASGLAYAFFQSKGL